MISVGLAAFAIVLDFYHVTRVVGFALRRDVASLLQKVVVGSANGAVRPRENCRLVETIGRNGKVFIDVGDVVHVLVPYWSGWCPFTGIAEHVEPANAREIGILVKHTRNNDLG